MTGNNQDHPRTGNLSALSDAELMEKLREVTEALERRLAYSDQPEMNDEQSDNETSGPNCS